MGEEIAMIIDAFGKASSFPELLGLLSLKERGHRQNHEKYVKLADKEGGEK